ncbi:MAG: copper resistance protein B [Asticcacaulis sp.]|uniref:copper resistance protein B n=1 Tax=Asticcacaulis sp. TaxID=1872648 RepID=UPI003F7CAF0C
MCTKIVLVLSVALASAAAAAHADDMSAHMGAGHEGSVFHAIRLETDLGRYDGQSTRSWDLDGWVGGDDNKLWLKSEGELSGAKTEHAEVWALYSRNIATFWDAQMGVRQDVRPSGVREGHSYLVAGVNGLAPYFFESEAHVFVRDDGAISARLKQENEILLTNRLILKPQVEVNFNGRKDLDQHLGTGLTDASLQLQTRYEITRQFAPYVAVTWQTKFGQTADMARAIDEKPSSTQVTAGIRWLF